MAVLSGDPVNCPNDLRRGHAREDPDKTSHSKRLHLLANVSAATCDQCVPGCLVFIGDRRMERTADLIADEQVARALAACQARITALSIGDKGPAPSSSEELGLPA